MVRAVDYEKTESGLLTRRRDGYFSAKLGQSFATAHQTPSTDVTGQTSFVATTPTFLFYQAAASNRILLRSMTLALVGTPPGGVVHVALAIDPTNRFSAGGTAVVPQNTSLLSSVAAGVTFKYNATASAAGAGADAPRFLYKWSMPAVVGAFISPAFDDEVIVGATGSILVYTWAATTGPTMAFGFGHLEEPA